MSEQPNKNRQICLPFVEETYMELIGDAMKFREQIDKFYESFPELFPSEIAKGYRMKDIYHSKKLPVATRRIEIEGISFTIHPSFIMPYMTGMVKDVEHPLFLRKFPVPFWAIAYVFGKDAMYWYRMEKALGRNSIVGTTIRKPEDLPEHLTADEKHTWIVGEKVYIATTVGKGCILGASIANDAGEESLIKAYSVFKKEAQCLKPGYSPLTVLMDAWEATRKAWTFIFTSAVIIYCLLHVFIKIRDRAKKKYKDTFVQASSKLWDCYYAKSKQAFSQRVRRTVEWCKKNGVPSVISVPLEKLHSNIDKYKTAYDYPGAYRTSNMLDRLMQRLDRHLFSTQYYHGLSRSAELSIRGWALILNFAPLNPRTIQKQGGFQSPAEHLNQFRYHSNWLQNLQVSASLGGFRTPPQKAL